MERSKYIIVLLILFFSYPTINANYKSFIYNAYITNDMQGWKNTLDQMNAQPTKTNEFRLEMVSYLYGYVAWCIGHEKTEEAEKYLEIGEQQIEVLEKINYKQSVVYAYKGAFYGYRIGLNLFKAPYYGPKSVDCAQLSMQQDAANPLGYIQYGNIQYYMPPIFGGSKLEALSYFLKAKELMEKDDFYVEQNWNYINLLTFIAQTYIVVDKFEEAKALYEYILKIEPNFVWVKRRLYPELLTLINEKK